jgi:hypothetical protein
VLGFICVVSPPLQIGVYHFPIVQIVGNASLNLLKREAPIPCCNLFGAGTLQIIFQHRLDTDTCAFDADVILIVSGKKIVPLHDLYLSWSEIVK